MEPSQKDVIQRNLTELITKTNCNEILFAELERHNILAPVEVNDIRYNHATPEAKARKLYDILQTKANSFFLLVAALTVTNQTGAVNILLQKTADIPNHGLIEIHRNQILGTGLKGNKVYLGTFDRQRVAVKVVREEEALNEVQHLRSLKIHDNIIRYYFAENRNGLIYIALELCDITLAVEMKCKKFNIEPTGILKNCTNGLAYLHGQNVIHRDLKPTNILINHAKQIKISDFGFSVKVDPTASAIEIFDKFGTPHWMAPEILQTFMNINPDPSTAAPKMSRRSDIFSLGCIYFFVLSNGNHPFGSNLANIYSRILNNTPDSLPFPLNEHWGALINSMLQPSPSMRPTAEGILTGFWLFCQSGSQSMSYNTFSQIRDKEHNSQFPALEPSRKVYNLFPFVGRHASMINDRSATVGESWKEEMGGTKYSNFVYPQCSSNFNERFAEPTGEFKMLQGFSRLSVENNTSSELRQDGDSYLYLKINGFKQNFQKFAKLLREDQPICVLALTECSYGVQKGQVSYWDPDRFKVSGYTYKLKRVDRGNQVVYVNDSFKYDLIQNSYDIFNCNMIEVISSDKPKALICPFFPKPGIDWATIINSFQRTCNMAFYRLKLGGGKRLIIFVDVGNVHPLSRMELRKVWDEFMLAQVHVKGRNLMRNNHTLVLVKTEDMDNVDCKADNTDIPTDEIIRVTYK